MEHQCSIRSLRRPYSPISLFQALKGIDEDAIADIQACSVAFDHQNPSKDAFKKV